MQTLLTERFIKGLRTEKTTEIVDTKSHGLSLVATARGKLTWYFRWTDGGKRLRSPSLGNHPASRSVSRPLSLAEARAKSDDMRGRVGRGEDPREALYDNPSPRSLRQGWTMEKLAELYVEKHASTKRSGKEDERMLRVYVIPAIGTMAVSKIKSHHIYGKVLEPILDRKKAHQADAVRRFLSKVFNFALDLKNKHPGPWRTLEYNPVATIRSLATKTPRDRALSDGEIAVVWAVCEAELAQAEAFNLLARMRNKAWAASLRWSDLDDRTQPTELTKALGRVPRSSDYIFPGKAPKGQRQHLSPANISTSSAVLMLALLQGQRKVETMGMRWREIDGQTWTIPAERTKNKLNHRVPLSTASMDVLRRLKALTGEQEHVFPGPNGAITDIKKAAYRVRSKAGIPHWTPHDLRRTLGTGLARFGVSRQVRGVILNHASSSQGVTDHVYNVHTYWSESTEALEMWGSHIMGLLAKHQL